MITVTAKDALRSEQLSPGWKPGRCTNYYTKAAKTDGSTLHMFEIEVDAGLPVAVPLKDYMISEKATSMGKNFFLACGFPKEEWDKLVQGKNASQTINPSDCVGKSFQVFVKNSEYEGRISNEAGDFLPLK
jgi:hypothetical protein